MPTRKRSMRPRKAPEKIKRHAISLKVDAALRQRIDAECQATGRSLAQQAEFLFEQAFRMQDLHAWLFQGTITVEEILALRRLWRELQQLVGTVAGDTGPDHWRRFIPAVVADLPSVVKHEFLRQMRADLAERGPPHLQPTVYQQEPGQPSRAVFEADRRRYWEFARRLLESEPALRSEFHEVWDTAQKVPITAEEKEAALDRFMREED